MRSVQKVGDDWVGTHVWELLFYFPVSPEEWWTEALSWVFLYLCSLDISWHLIHMQWVFICWRDLETKLPEVHYSFYILSFFVWPYELFKQQNLREERGTWFGPASSPQKVLQTKVENSALPCCPPLLHHRWMRLVDSWLEKHQFDTLVWKSHIGYYFSRDINIMLPL